MSPLLGGDGGDVGVGWLVLRGLGVGLERCLCVGLGRVGFGLVGLCSELKMCEGVLVRVGSCCC